MLTNARAERIPDDYLSSSTSQAFQSLSELYGSRESEPNDSAAQAILYPVGAGSLYGQLSSYSDVDYFAFDLAPGVFNVQVRPTATTSFENTFWIEDAAGNVLVAKAVGGSSTAYMTLSARIDTAGTYYVVVTKDSRYPTAYFGQDYELFPTLNPDIVGPPVSLDIDGDGQVDALTDGLLVIRYLFGFRGDVLIDSAVSPTATHTQAAEIEAVLLEAVDAILDVEGNGQVDALTDGLLVIRYLFGFPG